MKLLTLLCAVGLVALTTGLARAGEHTCVHCGCDHGCKKICRLVCEEKKVPIVCWGVADEDFCLPKPSKRGCKHKELVCDECETKATESKVHTGPKKFAWYDWTPAGKAKVFTKRKLMKKTIFKTLPSYKWVVEEVCETCEPQCISVVPEPGIPVPPPPPGAAKAKEPGAAE